jgi:hypothetical protein
MKRLAIIGILAASCVAFAQEQTTSVLAPSPWLPELGHWAYSRAINGQEWIPPIDCKSWPEGLTWAGGVVYDYHGCPYPKMDGKCDFETLGRVPGCMDRPPVLNPFPPYLLTGPLVKVGAFPNSKKTGETGTKTNHSLCNRIKNRNYSCACAKTGIR